MAAMEAPAKVATSPTVLLPATVYKRSTEHLHDKRSRSSTPLPEPLKKPDDQDDTSLPAFLRQSDAELQTKFEELLWQQQARISQARISKDPLSPWAQDSITRETKLRNRYGDIFPWANSRIRLKVAEGESDYINASPISLPPTNEGKEKKYIATQGPKAIGLDHFWQMIWHETSAVAVIVMLTQLKEGPREKCFQYYPEDVDSEGLPIKLTTATGEECDGCVTATESSFDEDTKSTVRKLLLTCGEETKIVWHFLFLGWPDFGVPEDQDRAALLELIRHSREKAEDLDNPRIIHCSAGVGRSGTFIALEHLLAELEVGNLDEVSDSRDIIYETVSKLREQRMMMVQSDSQYQLLYDLVREEYLQRHKEKSSPLLLPSTETDVLATEKLPPAGGEPSPKVMRLSKGIRNVFLRQSSRSRSRSRPPGDPSSEGKAPITP